MTAPRQLHELKPGVVLLEVATGEVWTIDRVDRPNSYAPVVVHLSNAAATRTADAGALLTARDGADDWHFAPAPPEGP
ncbi:MAG: hypothetical protein ACT4QF_22840 [Sporichthyaceae bacterium]